MDGDSYMRLKFYVDGSKRKATATIDLKKVRVSHFDIRERVCILVLSAK